MTNDISKLSPLIKNSYPSGYSALRHFYVGRIYHVIRITVKEEMKILHTDMDEFKSIINAVCLSIKRLDEFEAMVK